MIDSYQMVVELLKELKEVKSERDMIMKQLLVCDSIIHQYDCALMSGGVKIETLRKLKEKGKKRAGG